MPLKLVFDLCVGSNCPATGAPRPTKIAYYGQDQAQHEGRKLVPRYLQL